MTLDIDSTFSPTPLEDHGNHTFDGTEWWQESAIFVMSDPAAGFIGYYRIGRHPHFEASNAYYWTSAETLGVNDRQFRAGEPLAKGDVNNSQVADLQFETIEPMAKYRIVIDRPDYKVDVIFTPLFHPFMVHVGIGGASIAKGHFESIGRAVGTVHSGGQTIEVDAYGFMDRSWGERKSHIPASKWVFAVFDPGTFIHCFPVLSAKGTKHLIGYAAADGKLRPLTDDFDTGFSIGEDWLTPTACDFRAVDKDGREFRMTGRAQGPESIYPFLHGKFCVHVNASFEFAGKSGKGWLENSPPRAIPPTYVEHFGLKQRGMWMRPPEEIVE
tara:strand:+ start:8614 stop:9597 length:984 start_codon:yes stop_codon:yes gene_type:complete